MEEASAPKPCLEYTTKVEIDNDIFHIALAQKSEKLLIKINQVNSIPPFSYEAEFTKKELDKTSRYFRMFDEISELFPELQNKFEKKEYNIKKNENSLIINIKIDVKNIPDFSLIINKSNNSINETVQALCEMVKKLIEENKVMKSEIINLKKEVKELKEIKEKEKEKIKEENEYNMSKSDILKNNEDRIMLNNWIRPDTKIKFKLLYKVSRDGDRISTFTEKVKGKSPTLILIKTKTGYKFGGHTTVEWNMTGSYTYKKDENAFIFSINNKTKFNIKKGYEGDAK
jgi:vacuolar-type H+-ATPase subunit I/STV1